MVQVQEEELIISILGSHFWLPFLFATTFDAEFYKMKLPILDQIKRKSASKIHGPSANALTKAIIHLITLEGGFATRINSQGQFDPVKKIMRIGTTVRGMTDIVGVCKGLALFIEVKAGKDSLSYHQLFVQHRVESSGGKWFCARDFDSFHVWLKALLI